MREFVAIDFETANEKRSSACAIGLVLFDSVGKPSDSYYQLLHPHPEVNYFNPINVWTHGITAEDVKDSPEWPQVVSQVKDFIKDRPIVAHNMTTFDGTVLSALENLYATEKITNRRFCTLRLARKILAEEVERKSLDEVFHYYFPEDSFLHHHATSDAQAAGMIFSRMQQDLGYEELEELCPPSSPKKKSARSGVFTNQLAVSQLMERYGTSQALEGERVAFTGTLRHGKRADVQQLVSAIGGIAEKSLTKNTTLLVVGIPNPDSWSEGSPASRKLVKASKMRDNGSPIEVITEEEFFNRLYE